MPALVTPDGTRLAYRVIGEGPVLVCHPGGPGRPADYLGDLGGLPARRRLVLLDPRGTGRSGRPAEPDGYRFPRLAADLEVLREHLGLERMDLLGHSAGANVALAYAAAHPERTGRLILLTPSARLTGAPDEMAAVAARFHTGEPWHAEAVTALAALAAGDTDPALESKIEPLLYGRWDPAAAEHAARSAATVAPAARDGFDDPDFDRDALVAALGRVTARAAVLAGDRDPVTGTVAPRIIASWLPGARLDWLPGCGHFPWLDDPVRTLTALDAALAD
jgi:proline iminopeptidase